MKKILINIILLAIITLSGCQKSTDTFLDYDKLTLSTQESSDNIITEADFFAKDIVVITDEQNTGEDSNLNAGAVLLIDITNKQAVYSSNVYDRMYPASLVKLLSTLIVLEHGELTDNVIISQNAASLSKSSARVCGYKDGDIASMETLINSLLVYSGNDAAVAIAEHIGGTNDSFVALMNKEAVQIGAVASNFVNPHGLHDDNQFTTAYDMYLIFNELLQYDTFRTIINKSSYDAEYSDRNGNNKHKSLKSTNLYLTGEAEALPGIEIIGGISGSTRKSGSCLILLCKDSNNTEYIAVILNASDNESLYSQMSYLVSLIASR